MLKRVLVVEDDSRQAVNLTKMIKGIGEGIIVFTAQNHEAALEIAEREPIDLFFLDIDLENHENGYELAEKLRVMPNYELAWIVFLTVNKAYELKAYKRIHCYEYLIKPYNALYVKDLTRKLLFCGCASVPCASESYILVEVRQLHLKINIDEIICVEARGRGVEIHTTRGTYHAPYTPLKRIGSDLLIRPAFVQTHRSYIINVNYVNAIHKIAARQYEVRFMVGDKAALLSIKHKDKMERLLLEFE